MSAGAVIERVRRADAVRADAAANRRGLERALGDLAAVRAWCDATEADLVRRLAATVSFPEGAIADSTRHTLHHAGKTLERSKTLNATPKLADALAQGAITAGHVDSITRAASMLDAGQRGELTERCDALADVAALTTIEQWTKRVRQLAKSIQRDDGIDRLARQKQATTLSSWVDGDGMWNLRARFDPGAGWQITWPIPIELPNSIVAELINAGTADLVPVVVRNGVVIHAPGELELGRTTRLANRAQRRALRAMYATCPIPGCAVCFDQCKIHHVVWWRHGGRTDLVNLIPVCHQHHAKIHHDGWTITLGPDRELRIALPDGNVMATGPPRRCAA